MLFNLIKAYVAEWLAKHERREIRINDLLGFPAQVRILSYAFLMEYLCNECNGIVELSPTDPIICNFCGSRILYKTRTKQILQYEARKF